MSVVKKSNQRESAFEFVKIIAMIAIVFCHSVPTERIEYHFATNNPWLFGVILFRQLGSVGNAIFLVASTWFLVDSDKVDLGKTKRMIADNQAISIGFLIVFLLIGYNLTIKTMTKQIFPFFFSTLWYVTCYILYYCLHGFINNALRNSMSINSKHAVIVLFITSWLIFMVGSPYFTQLTGFIIVHVFTWYLKKIIKQWNDLKIKRYSIGCLTIGISGWIVGAIILNIIGVLIEGVGQRLSNWNSFFNPLILFAAYGCILLASSSNFNSKYVNTVSSYSLYIYMITGNQLLRTYSDNEFYDLICQKFGPSMTVCFIFVIVYSIIKLCIGFGLAVVYKMTFAKVIDRIIKNEYAFLISVC